MVGSCHQAYKRLCVSVQTSLGIDFRVNAHANDNSSLLPVDHLKEPTPPKPPHCIPSLPPPPPPPSHPNLSLMVSYCHLADRSSRVVHPAVNPTAAAAVAGVVVWAVMTTATRVRDSGAGETF